MLDVSACFRAIARTLTAPAVIRDTKRPITVEAARRDLITHGMFGSGEVLQPGEGALKSRSFPMSLFETNYNPHDYIEIFISDRDDICAVVMAMLTLRGIALGSLPANPFLFLDLGEQHYTTRHIVTQAYLAAALPGVPFGNEQPSNDLAVYAGKYYGVDLSALSLEALQEADPLGHLYARAVMANNRFPAPLAKNHRLASVVRGGGAVVNIDAMRKRGILSIDERDPVAQRCAQDLQDSGDRRFKHIVRDLADLPTVTRRGDNRGEILRNAVMAARGFDALERLDQNEMQIGTGRAHLGDKRDRIGAEDALPAMQLREAFRRGAGDKTAVISMRPDIPSWLARAQDMIPPGATPGHIPVVVYGLPLERRQNFSDDPLIVDVNAAVSFHLAGLGDYPVMNAFDSPPEIDQQDIKHELLALQAA